jgi:hypothetical protein
LKILEEERNRQAIKLAKIKAANLLKRKKALAK